MSRNLIIITGVGNWSRIYAFFAFVWQFYGYKAVIGAFRWEDPAATFDTKMKKLLADIDAMHGPVYLIGLSAGGTAAVNALAARPDKISKVAVLCAPLTTMAGLRNPLLAKSIAMLPGNIEQLAHSTRKVISVHGTRDNVVAPSLSKIPGVRDYRLLTRGHALTLFTGMTIFSFPIRKFFRS